MVQDFLSIIPRKSVLNASFNFGALDKKHGNQYNKNMLEGIKAVAFDIDGTLYPDWKLYVRILPYILKNLSFYRNFGKVRKILHKTAPLADFYEYQARILAEMMKIPKDEAKSKIRSICYDGMKPFFTRFSPYPQVLE